jgi:hypothetical protein
MKISSLAIQQVNLAYRRRKQIFHSKSQETYQIVVSITSNQEGNLEISIAVQRRRKKRKKGP